MENNCPPKPINQTPIEDDKKEYLLELGTNGNEINLKLNTTNEIVPYIYDNNYKLEELVKISKIFKLCDNTIEVVSYLNENFENNITILKEENSDLISLSFKMILPNKKEENFQLFLNKKLLNTEISLKNLYNIINDIQIENKKKILKMKN